LPTLAILQARHDANAIGLVSATIQVMHQRGERPALLWLERTEALGDGVSTVASVPALFPEALRASAELAEVARMAHIGPNALAPAFRALIADLGAADRIVMDGQLLAVARAHVAAIVTGDDIGPLLESAAPLRSLCDVEVFEPSEAIALGLALALERRAR
jgi:hypothetical protein